MYNPLPTSPAPARVGLAASDWMDEGRVSQQVREGSIERARQMWKEPINIEAAPGMAPQWELPHLRQDRPRSGICPPAVGAAGQAAWEL